MESMREIRGKARRPPPANWPTGMRRAAGEMSTSLIEMPVSNKVLQYTTRVIMIDALVIFYWFLHIRCVGLVMYIRR